MEKEILYRGTFIKFSTKDKEVQSFLLVENHEKDYVFQIISISGYKVGLVCGYIKTDSMVEKKNHQGVSMQHLVNELNRNFENINWSTFKAATNESDCSSL